jgi:8-oxo-dGTP pyrophosphatase MutT (NUDIX family)
MASRPEWFSGRPRRPIVCDPQILEAFAGEHGVVLGVATETPYLWLLNDLVQSRDRSGATLLHPYLRLVPPPGGITAAGVVVLATVRAAAAEAAESIVFVEQERHATGTLELELPRGFGVPGTAPGVQALRELREETGYAGDRAECLGTTVTDSGTSDGAVSFFHVPVTGSTAVAPEPEEAISRVVLLTREEVWARIDSGALRDAFTVQALALYERRLRSSP